MQDANADGNRAAVSMIQSMVLLLNLMAGNITSEIIENQVVHMTDWDFSKSEVIGTAIKTVQERDWAEQSSRQRQWECQNSIGCNAVHSI